MGRLTEVAGIVGGSVGGIYAVGYLAVAGQYRILGLPNRAIDVANLLSSAWEFLLRGVLLAALWLPAPSRGQTVLAVALVAVALVVIMVPRLRRFGVRPLQRLDFFWRVHTRECLLLVLMAVAVAQALLCSSIIVPASTVTSLLYVREPVVSESDEASWHRYINARRTAIRKAIVGDGASSDTGTLGPLYVAHLAVALLSFALAVSVYRKLKAIDAAPLARMFALAVTIVGALFLFYTPVLYGALLKSYRFPLVQFIPAPALQKDHALAVELKASAFRPKFLLEMTDREIFVYDRLSDEVHVISRDAVGSVRILAPDFIFRVSRSSP